MKKSKFNLSHPASFTASMGNLIPFCVIDCVPNDSFRIKAKSFIRAQPMMAPLMHQVNFFVQYWFVPYRILWDNWTDFITGGLDGVTAPTFPTLKVTPEVSTLSDYFGLPVNGNELEVSALPFRAYTKIWNERYRDEDLQTELPLSYEDGLDTTTNTTLKRCSWAKDYFTTARPFTQRGSQISVPVIPTTGSTKYYSLYRPSIQSDGKGIVFDKPEGVELGRIVYGAGGAVTYSISENLTKDTTSGYITVVPYCKFANVYWNASGPACSTDGDIKQWINLNDNGTFNGTLKTGYYNVTNIIWGAPVSYADSKVVKFNIDSEVASGQCRGDSQTSGLTGYPAYNITCPKNLQNITAELTLETVDTVGNGAINIRDLRTASAMQRYQERSLEYGNRYEEYIQREFGIRPRDARIQRPEYLGGAKTTLQISEVLQTAEAENTGVGTMRGHGVGAMSSRGIRFRCPEHGVIIGLFSIRPYAVYTQGLNKFWRKFSKFDYYVPELANIGMQEVMQSEIYADGSNYDTVFGYAPRYSEYRSIPSRISGEFRSTLDYWNLARKFDAPPVLNGSFLEMNPSKRIFAEQISDSFLVMLANDIRAFRPIPKRAKNILM